MKSEIQRLFWIFYIIERVLLISVLYDSVIYLKFSAISFLNNLPDPDVKNIHNSFSSVHQE